MTGLAMNGTLMTRQHLPSSVRKKGAPTQICNRRWPAPTVGGGPDGAPARRFGVRCRWIIPSLAIKVIP